MLRGITEGWCFPYFVDFDFKIEKAEYCQLIEVAASLGFPILVSTCDQGGGNIGLQGKLEVSKEQPIAKVKLSDDDTANVIFIHDIIHEFKAIAT